MATAQRAQDFAWAKRLVLIGRPDQMPRRLGQVKEAYLRAAVGQSGKHKGHPVGADPVESTMRSSQ